MAEYGKPNQLGLESVEKNIMKKWRNMGNQTNWDWNMWKKYMEKWRKPWETFGKPNQLGLEYVGKNGLRNMRHQLGCGKNGMEHVGNCWETDEVSKANTRTRTRGQGNEDGNWSQR